jgi:hypothetical protein
VGLRRWTFSRGALSSLLVFPAGFKNVADFVEICWDRPGMIFEKSALFIKKLTLFIKKSVLFIKKSV